MKLKGVPHVEVCLRVNGANLQEYDDEDDRGDETKGVKYVESMSGSTFTVFLTIDGSKLSSLTKDQANCVVFVDMDGKAVSGNVMDKHQPTLYSSEIPGRGTVVDGRHVLQRFIFTDLSTNDNNAGSMKPSDFQNLGTVVIKLYWARMVSISTATSQVLGHKPLASESIPEKCLKGRSISNQAALAKPEPVARPLNVANVQYLNGRKEFASYVFKYRSRKDLQIEDVIPRSPSPTPLEDRDPNDLSPEEARELVRRMRAREMQNNIKIKKEKRNRASVVQDEDEDEDDVTISEAPARKRHRASTDSGVEVIDLSDG